jgi:hypothetical protein
VTAGAGWFLIIMPARFVWVALLWELLKAFTDLAGAGFTIDAMHTQHDTAQAILGLMLPGTLNTCPSAMT